MRGSNTGKVMEGAKGRRCSGGQGAMPSALLQAAPQVRASLQCACILQFHLYILLVVNLFIQPALQQASLPHHQHLRLDVPGGVDVLLRCIRGGLVPRAPLLMLILLLRSSIWRGLLLVMLVPLLLLPLLPLLVLLLILLVLLPVLSRPVSWLTRTSRAAPGVWSTTLVAISSSHNIVCDLLVDVVRNVSVPTPSIHPILDLVDCHGHLDRLPPQSGHPVHAGHRGLLLHLVVEPDEPEPLAEPTLVQDHIQLLSGWKLAKLHPGLIKRPAAAAGGL